MQMKVLDYLRYTAKWVRDCLTWDRWSVRSWSQEGEDILLSRIFAHKKNGFYVDIGAHHPKRFSNTYLFYRNGWRGINVDALPGSMKAFRRSRRRDINLEVGVSDKSDQLDYYMFNEPALNSFSKSLSETRSDSASPYHLQGVRRVEVVTLRWILEQYCKGRHIDFLSVDTEGHDLQVLRSNDWNTYRPRFVLAEHLRDEVQDSYTSLTSYMSEVGYNLYAEHSNTLIFADSHTDLDVTQSETTTPA